MLLGGDLIGDPKKLVAAAAVLLLKSIYTLQAVVFFSQLLVHAFGSNAPSAFYVMDNSTNIEWQFFLLRDCTVYNVDGNPVSF